MRHGMFNDTSRKTMPMELSAISGLWPLVKRLPSFMLRWYFTKERLAEFVYLDLYPRNESAVVNLGSDASFRLHLQLINLSPFRLELDRANFRFSCGSVVLKAAVLERRSFAAGEIASIFLEESMSDGQANQVASHFVNNPVGLDGNIEFNCEIHPFQKPIRQLTGIQAKLVNANFRQVPINA